MREFAVGDYLVRPDRNVVVSNGEETHVEPRVMDLLVYFAERPGEVLSSDRLIRDVWPHVHVTDSALLTAISSLRKVFRDDPRRPALIETIPKRGYRLVARSSARKAALAVLPLRNVSDSPDQDYFADGMTDALIAALGRIRALRVISRQSVMAYRGSAEALPTIARELGAGLVVEGTVLFAPERVRISIQLIDAFDDSHLWAESYERDLKDVLTVQREISGSIAHAISRQLITPEPSGRTARSIEPDALIAYLRGRFHFYKFSPAHLERALAHFNEAIEKDPAFASAYACLADLWGAYGYWGFRPAYEVRQKVYEFAVRAQEIDPNDAESVALIGAYQFYLEHDYATAEATFVRAIDLNPSLAPARLLYALFLGTMRRPETLDEIDAAVRLDPLNPAVLLARAMWLASENRGAEAEATIRGLLDIEPRHGPALELLADLKWSAEPDAALRLEIEAQSGDEEIRAVLMSDAATRDPRAAMGAASTLLEARAEVAYVQPRRIARLQTHAGRFDDALGSLERAVSEADLFQIDFLVMSPVWNPLREHPRFKALLALLGLPNGR